ncbi:MAG: ABC transporter [Microgenomates group bacterium GW2011_GWF2_47_9]|nr:MAG: ABC transporter [Microgenomates group bacterium GW2011_GWF2_47_9]
MKQTKKHSDVVMSVEHVDKDFRVGTQTVSVLKDVSTQIGEGDFFVIFGPSGSGKSTLLHTLLGLEQPTRGKVILLEKEFSAMNQDEAAEFRKSRVGMVYQQPYWIKSLSVIENVAFPLFLLGQLPSLAYGRAGEMLKVVGMEDWRNYSPTELSAGQQQRISLARALINDPAILVADEPTGNLDTQSGEELMQLLAELNKDQGRTIVMVTHDLEYLKYATRMIRVVDGRVENEYGQKEIDKIFKQMGGKRGSRRVQALEVAGDTKNKHIASKNGNVKVQRKISLEKEKNAK